MAAAHSKVALPFLLWTESHGHGCSSAWRQVFYRLTNHWVKLVHDHSLPRPGLSWRLQYTHPFANNPTADTSSTHLPDWSLYRKHSKIAIWVLKAPYSEGGNILSKFALYDFSISPCRPEGVHFHIEHDLFSTQIFITNLLCVKDFFEVMGPWNKRNSNFVGLTSEQINKIISISLECKMQ